LRAISCEPYSVVVMDAAIQRFEYTFEAFWKFVRDYLREIDGVVYNSPRSCFREALDNGFIWEEQAMVCMEMTDDRNLTSHTYVEELDEQMYKKNRKLPQAYGKHTGGRQENRCRGGVCAPPVGAPLIDIATHKAGINPVTTLYGYLFMGVCFTTSRLQFKMI